MLTAADFELAAVLTSKVRAVTEDQAVRFYAHHGVGHPRAAARRIKELVRTRLVRQSRVLLRPVLSLDGPLYSWQPGDAAPDFPAVAWQLEKRWRQPLEPTRVLFASRRATRIFGGWANGVLDNVPQLSHDVHVSEIYLRFLTACPDRAAAWVAGEEIKTTSTRFAKVPDAILCSNDDYLLALDFGGAYGPAKIAALHRNLEDRLIPYEMW